MHTAKAKKAYQDFFELWKDADSDIAILKQARVECAFSQLCAFCSPFYGQMSANAMFRQEGTAWLQAGILQSSIYLSSNNLAPMYKTVSVLASFSGPRPYDPVA
jgi:hypothetical protein